MTPSSWLSPLIFLTGYSPLVLILLVRDFELKTFQFQSPWLAAALAIVTGASIIFSLQSLRGITGGHPIQIQSSRDASSHLVEYSLPYLVSFLDVSLKEPSSLIPLLIFMWVLYVVAKRTQTLFMSPVLLLEGYALYEAAFLDTGKEKNCLILTRRTLQKGSSCRAHLFSAGMLFVPDKDEPTSKRPIERSKGAIEANEGGEFSQSTYHALGSAQGA